MTNNNGNLQQLSQSKAANDQQTQKPTPLLECILKSEDEDANFTSPTKTTTPRPQIVLPFRPDATKKSAYWIDPPNTVDQIADGGAHYVEGPASCTIQGSSSAHRRDLTFFVGGFQLVCNARNVEVYLIQLDKSTGKLKEDYLTTCRGLAVDDGARFKVLCVIPGGPTPVQGVRLHLKSLRPTTTQRAEVVSIKLTARIQDPIPIVQSQPQPQPFPNTTLQFPQTTTTATSAQPTTSPPSLGGTPNPLNTLYQGSGAQTPAPHNPPNGNNNQVPVGENGPTPATQPSNQQAAGITQADLGAALSAMTFLVRNTEASLAKTLQVQMQETVLPLMTSFHGLSGHLQQITALSALQKATLDQQTLILQQQARRLDQQAGEIHQLREYQEDFLQRVEYLAMIQPKVSKPEIPPSKRQQATQTNPLNKSILATTGPVTGVSKGAHAIPKSYKGRLKGMSENSDDISQQESISNSSSSDGDKNSVDVALALSARPTIRVPSSFVRAAKEQRLDVPPPSAYDRNESARLLGIETDDDESPDPSQSESNSKVASNRTHLSTMAESTAATSEQMNELKTSLLAHMEKEEEERAHREAPAATLFNDQTYRQHEPHPFGQHSREKTVEEGTSGQQHTLLTPPSSPPKADKNKIKPLVVGSRTRSPINRTRRHHEHEIEFEEIPLPLEDTEQRYHQKPQPFGLHSRERAQDTPTTLLSKKEQLALLVVKSSSPPQLDKINASVHTKASTVKAMKVPTLDIMDPFEGLLIDTAPKPNHKTLNGGAFSTSLISVEEIDEESQSQAPGSTSSPLERMHGESEKNIQMQQNDGAIKKEAESHGQDLLGDLNYAKHEDRGVSQPMLSDLTLNSVDAELAEEKVSELQGEDATATTATPPLKLKRDNDKLDASGYSDFSSQTDSSLNSNELELTTERNVIADNARSHSSLSHQYSRDTDDSDDLTNDGDQLEYRGKSKRPTGPSRKGERGGSGKHETEAPRGKVLQVNSNNNNNSNNNHQQSRFHGVNGVLGTPPVSPCRDVVEGTGDRILSMPQRKVSRQESVRRGDQQNGETHKQTESVVEGSKGDGTVLERSEAEKLHGPTQLDRVARPNNKVDQADQVKSKEATQPKGTKSDLLRGFGGSKSDNVELIIRVDNNDDNDNDNDNRSAQKLSIEDELMHLPNAVIIKELPPPSNGFASSSSSLSFNVADQKPLLREFTSSSENELHIMDMDHHDHDQASVLRRQRRRSSEPHQKEQVVRRGLLRRLSSKRR